MTSGSSSPRRKSLSTPHTTWMSVTLLRAGSAPPARSNFRFHSRTSCSAPGTRYSPVWGTGKGAQPRGTTALSPSPSWPLPLSSLVSPPRSHTAPPVRAPRVAWRARSQPAHPGENNANLCCAHCPALQPGWAEAQHPRASSPEASWGHGEVPPSPAVPPSPHGARRGGEAWVCRGWGTAPDTWCVAAAGTGST